MQQRIRERKEEVVRMLVEDGAYFYVCGSAGMARDVRRALVEVLMEGMGWVVEEAKRFVGVELKAGKRLQEDVWSG